MFKACSRCGKIHPYDYDCTMGRYLGGREREFRSSSKWTKKSLQMREQSHHLCEVCLDKGKFTYDNIEVHHIIKVRDDMSKVLDDDNLICLCQEHHKQADRGDLSIDYLRRLVAKRETALH